MPITFSSALDGQSASIDFNGIPRLTLDATGVYGANTIGEICWFAFSDIPKRFLLCNGAQPLRTSYPTLFSKLVKSSFVTFPVVSSAPISISWPGNKLSLYDPVKFSAPVPIGINAGATYYAINITPSGFNICADPINSPSAITGTIASPLYSFATNAPWGDGNGTTTFTLPNLLDMTVRGWNPASGRSFGSFQNWATAAQSGAVELGKPGDFGSVFGTSGVFFSHGNVQPNRHQGTGGGGGSLTLGISIGTPGATETRSANYALLPCISAY